MAGNLREPSALINASPDNKPIANEDIHDPDLRSVVRDLILDVDRQTRGRHFPTPAEFVEFVRQEAVESFRAGPLARYIDLRHVDVELRKTPRDGKGRGERHTTSRGHDTISPDSRLTANNQAVASDSKNDRIVVDGKLKLLHVRNNYLSKVRAL